MRKEPDFVTEDVGAGNERVPPEFIRVLARISSEDELHQFLKDLLSISELTRLEKRWTALVMLDRGATQREISDQLGVGVQTATRAAQTFNRGTGVARFWIEKMRSH